VSNSKEAVANLVDAEPSSNEQEELELVRKLLFASDRARINDGLDRLDKLEQKLSDPKVRAEDAAEVLVPAVRKRLAKDEGLGEALKPVVVSQFHQTARDEPDIMADALFPILGPAMRKMITAMLTPDKNAKKRSYRLEQLYLIDKETGLPVCHVASESASTQDADMVSGMLNAIQSFVHDAFSADEFDGLNTLQVGELSVWIEWGPSAVLAGVIRGVAPQKVREAMQELLEQVHQDYRTQLTDYSGDQTPFEPLRPELVKFLDTHDGSFRNKIRQLPSRIKHILASLAVALIAFIVWTAYGLYDTNRWDDYVDKVEQLPGVLVTQSERSFRSYELTGLLDPLAQHPDELLKDTSINPDYVKFQFKPYRSLDEGFTLQRLRTLLDPPSGVTLRFENNTLYLGGAVELEWLNSAKKMAQVVTGVDRIYLAD